MDIVQTQAERGYGAFLANKHPRVAKTGFEISTAKLNRKLFPFQRSIVRTALEHGRYSCFAGTGLGKTGMQLEVAHQVVAHTDGRVLVLAPLAVARQTEREGAKFGIECKVVRHADEVTRPGVYVTNYDLLHQFDTSKFIGVVLDESSILKNYTGATKRKLQDGFQHCQYSLLCTATPSPNDHLELGNHAEFMHVMRSSEMISRWFLNDTMKAGGYNLKAHAARDFWRWVASWSVAIDKPSDIGFDDDGFILPPLEIVEHVVTVDHTQEAGGMLLRVADLSATSLHKEMRLTVNDRATRVNELVRSEPGEPWVVWCNTDYEADALMERLPSDAVEVRGPEKPKAKEDKLNAFSDGNIRILVSKPSICGFGMNWQHCSHMAFVGLSYSFEALYQALRRSWRYGQTRKVHAHMVMADTEGPVLKTLQRKQAQHEEMRREMVKVMAEVQAPDWAKQRVQKYAPKAAMQVPSWLGVGA